MRECKSCLQTFDLSYFALAGIVKEKEYRRHLCVKCYSKSKQPRKDKIKTEYIEWKKTLKCNRCGFDDYRALQFHHDGNKEANVSDLFNRRVNLDKIKEEALKCEVLCANCHQIHHHNGA